MHALHLDVDMQGGVECGGYPTARYTPQQTIMDGYKLLVTYNVLAHREMEYRRFMIQRWLPGLQKQGLEAGEMLHTLWGDYPVRLVVLYAPDVDTMKQALTSDEWQQWHEQLQKLVRNLQYRIVPARPWLQF